MKNQLFKKILVLLLMISISVISAQHFLFVEFICQTLFFYLRDLFFNSFYAVHYCQVVVWYFQLVLDLIQHFVNSTSFLVISSKVLIVLLINTQGFFNVIVDIFFFVKRINSSVSFFIFHLQTEDEKIHRLLRSLKEYEDLRNVTRQMIIKMSSLERLESCYQIDLTLFGLKVTETGELLDLDQEKATLEQINTFLSRFFTYFIIVNLSTYFF